MTIAEQVQHTANLTMPAFVKPRAARPAICTTSKGSKFVTWKEFERHYLQRDDGFKYEWADGKVEKTPYALTVQQLYIWKNLNRHFQNLKQRASVNGELTTETDTFLAELMHRRPDLAYFTDEQIDDAVDNPVQVPSFVIEVVSPSDNANKVNKKALVYFNAGVRVVWNIFPELQEVHVYESATRIHIARGEALCSAEPLIPGFVLSADAVFAR